MMKKFVTTIMMLISTLVVMAQKAEPTVSFLGSRDDDGLRPEMVLKQGESGNTEAPSELTCEANVECPEDYTYKVEWRFSVEDGGGTKPILTRFDDNITYTLNNDGTTIIQLFVTFTSKDGKVEDQELEPIKVTVAASKLNCMDGLSPNGDGKNDKLVINCQSIVKCSGCIFNRWGQKLHTFTVDNLADGWDGYVNGRVVKDGVYFVNINAVGSDGIHYKIKKAINVLKGYRESNETDGSDL